MRSYHKGWQDRRRVRWYQGGPGESIRLNFEEYGEVYNEFFADATEAQAAFDRFIAVAADASYR